jgi:single-stranded-DNA-specific exonuclease
MDDANMSLRLLMTSDSAEAQRLATELSEVNSQRQQSTADVYERVMQRLREKRDRLLLLDADPSYEEGVIGLVAGKVSKEYYRPAVVVTRGEDLCRGSARSIPEFDLAAALERCADILVSFGGHPLAAGFAVAPEHLAQLEERLLAQATEQLTGLDLHPRIEIDAEVRFKDLSLESYRDMRSLEPFGQQNPEPCFITRGVEVAECHSFRNHEKWSSLRLRHNGALCEAVDFRTLRGPDDIPALIDVVYNLRLRRWNGDETLQVHILDLAQSAIS